MTESSSHTQVLVRLVDRAGHLSEPLSLPVVQRTDAEWRARLAAEPYQVTRSHGTERPFCGIFHDNHLTGLYACICCGLPLFLADAKFDSGTGWPSFFQPLTPENIGSARDTSLGRIRTEVHCVRCAGHLGHVFPDGPAPTGLRFCINSASLQFLEQPAKKEVEHLVMGGGDVSGLEMVVRSLEGVLEVQFGTVQRGDALAVAYRAEEAVLRAVLEAGRTRIMTGGTGFFQFTVPAQERSIREFFRTETPFPDVELAGPFTRIR